MTYEYDILASADVGRLVEIVNVSLVKGWQPIGGVSVTYRDQCMEYCQAIVRVVGQK